MSDSTDTTLLCVATLLSHAVLALSECPDPSYKVTRRTIRVSRSLLKSTASCPSDPATTLASVNGSRGHSTSPAWCLCIQNPPLPILSFHVFSNRRHVLDIASLAGCLPNILLSSHQHAQFVIWLGVKHSAVVLRLFSPGAISPPPICLDPKSPPPSSPFASPFPSPGCF